MGSQSAGPGPPLRGGCRHEAALRGSVRARIGPALRILAGRGLGLTRPAAAAATTRTASRNPGSRSRASARLGAALRSVLLAPRDGFTRTLNLADRRHAA